MGYKILVGDALKHLSDIPNESVQCVVTSPPYWGLRDYGVVGQLGSEPTPEIFVQNLVEIFCEVRRVLRKDGSIWVNLGDSYASQGGGSDGNHGGLKRHRKGGRTNSKKGAGLKRKDLVGIPWRVALALQADGWYLRSDCIWHKPDPMPESVTDRPARSHEYLFMLAKSPQYYYDAEAVKEPTTGGAHPRGSGVNPKAKTPSCWNTGPGRHDTKDGRYKSKQNESWSAAVTDTVSHRHRRTVWTIPTQPWPGSHTATFPEALVKPCILASTSEKGCCEECGAPWERIIEKGEPDLDHQVACGGDSTGGYNGAATKDYAAAGAENPSEVKARILEGMRHRRTVGWKPTCEHDGAATIPCTVLDPFGGTGTTGAVAVQNGREAIIIELNPDYAKDAGSRIQEAGRQLSLISKGLV